MARETGREDPGHVVLDEVAGQWIALIACPVDWKHALLALLLFRGFDIVKPWPARQLENLPGDGASCSMMLPPGCMLCSVLGISGTGFRARVHGFRDIDEPIDESRTKWITAAQAG